MSADSACLQPALKAASYTHPEFNNNNNNNMATKGITRVRKKNENRKKEYNESHHSVRLVSIVWERWNRLKLQSCQQTHDKFASILMDCWEQYGSKSVKPTEMQTDTDVEIHQAQDITPVKSMSSATVPLSSTPFTDTKDIRPMLEEISDISEGSPSCPEIQH
ncbi:uncharacterized protein LOC127873429 [Dreissena polymorpha]|uniref:Uncharacterized protein n=1 Tax=Dreissena polymorpha TaxID=45954 RepID=A0A9D4KVG0_DREPO|nr:uncharacterized protein LOC127873429 [Dreissena polymorpha]KAH3846863.1 hypothetical protein DPMN_089169 [Dreissena polymorpha]